MAPKATMGKLIEDAMAQMMPAAKKLKAETNAEVDDMEDEEEEDEQQSIFFYFDDDEQTAYPAPFIHQYFPDKHVLDGYEIQIHLDTASFVMLAAGRNVEEQRQLSDADLCKLLAPFIANLPAKSIFFDPTDFEKAIAGEGLQMISNLESWRLGNYTAYSGRAAELPDSLQMINKRIQALLLFFIDAASVIDETDPKWGVTLVTRKDGREPVKLVAYATNYDFYHFPDKLRRRISQFLVLSPYQRQGIGSLLYGHLMAIARGDDRISEVTVEDPSDEFSNLRLINDWKYWSAHENKDASETIRLKNKWTALQFTEIKLLEAFSRMPDVKGPEDSNAEFVAWRKEMKRHLAKKYPDCIPKDAPQDKIRVLAELFAVEFQRFCNLLHRP